MRASLTLSAAKEATTVMMLPIAHVSSSRRKTAFVVAAVIVCVLMTALSSPPTSAQPASLTQVEEQVSQPVEGDGPGLVDGKERSVDDVLPIPGSVPADCSIIRSAHGGNSLRENLGLENDVPSGELTETAFDGLRVSRPEKLLLDANYAARAKLDILEVRESVTDIFGDEYIGINWIAAQGFVVNVTDQDPSDNDAQLTDLRGRVGDSDEILTLRVVEGGTPDSRRVSNSRHITKEARELSDLGYHTSMTDQTCGHLIVYAFTDSDTDQIVSALERVMPRSDFTIILTDKTEVEEDRTDHHNPYVGGLVVNLDGPNSGNCTSNVGWWKAGNERWAVTAAHCVGTVSPDPRAAYWDVFTQNEAWAHGGQDLNDVSGLTTYLLYGGRGDIAVTRLDNTYTIVQETVGTIFGSGADQHVWMNWWQWDRQLAVVGDAIRQSGLNWNTPRLGTLQANDHTFTGTSTITGLWSHFHDIMDASYASAGGDSGGTIWTVDSSGAAWLSGIHRAGGGIYTHIEEVQNAFGMGAPANMS